MTTLTLPLPDLAEQFLLRKDIVFLNHGSFGACPRPVFETYQNWQRELEAQPVEFLGRRIDQLRADARAGFAPYIGANPDDIVFVPNATHGVNIVARSLDLQEGDEVLSTDHEYGASDRAWKFVCRQRGVKYINYHISLPLTTPEAMIDELWTGVTERTKVIFISHITSSTAVIFPLAEICKRARAAGIITVIDGAHAPGQIDLDMEAIGADYYTGNCHKWLCAPKGAAFLHARPERQAILQPLIVSWGWESNNPSSSDFQDYFGWTGTQDPSAYLSVPAAVAFQQENNWTAVRAACHSLLVEARHRIQELTELDPLTSDSELWWSQMCVVPLPECDLAVVKDRLWDEFQVEVPMTSWNERPGVRISVQAYNSPNDIDRLIEGLKTILF